jgi:tRNA threonylcarbamoyl adenosine modification protein YeaZ
MKRLSIAMETTCRWGGLALGIDERLVETVSFDASARHATQLVARLSELLARHGFKSAELAELYVSAGPGSFTGTRVGVTVARTLALAVPAMKLVRVPTIEVVAAGAAALDWQNLAVLMDHKDEMVYAGVFSRQAGQVVAKSPASGVRFADFIAAEPRPLMLLGEGVSFVAVPGEPGVSVAPTELHLPTAQGVWQVGHRLAAAGEFVDAPHMLPIYSRQPEAVRLWDLKAGRK